MENTFSAQFPNSQPEFFLVESGQAVGPFAAQDVALRLEKKESSWSDYIYRRKEGKWMRIFEHPMFQELLPKAPAAPPVGSATPPPPGDEQRCWFLLKEQQQTGPYTFTEVKRVISMGGSEGLYLWKSGMMEWLPPDQAFAGVEPRPENREKRVGLRRPVTARIFLTNQEELILGVCRDLSIGGMQVLSERLPGPVGTTIRLNVDPSQDMKLHGFSAEGVVVRHLEDLRGFSFRFTRISELDRTAIEQFIEQAIV
jgi:hypothetical protein